MDNNRLAQVLTGHTFCMKGKLAVLRPHAQDIDPMEDEPSEKFDLKVYDNATDTWELNSLNLGPNGAECCRWESEHRVFSSYYA